jgi:hypothetical protein
MRAGDQSTASTPGAIEAGVSPHHASDAAVAACVGRVTTDPDRLPSASAAAADYHDGHARRSCFSLTAGPGISDDDNMGIITHSSLHRHDVREASREQNLKK